MLMTAPGTRRPYAARAGPPTAPRAREPGPGPQTAGRGRQRLSLPVSSRLCSAVTLVPQGRRPHCGCAGAGRCHQGSGGGSAFWTKALVQERPRSLPGVTAQRNAGRRSGRPGRQAPLDPRPLPGSGGGRAWTELPTLMCESVLHHVAVKCPPARVRPPETVACLQKALQKGPGLCDAVKASPGLFTSKGEKKPSLQAGLT